MSSKKSKDTKKQRKTDAMHRRDMQLRGIRGSRILLIRILTTVCLCLDVYWILWLGNSNGDIGIEIPGPVFAPLICVILDAMAIWEQARIMTYGLTKGLGSTFRCAAGGILVIAGVMSATIIFGKDVFFYFFTSSAIALALCVIGIAVRAVILYRVNLINTNTDKQYELYRKTVDGEYKF